MSIDVRDLSFAYGKRQVLRQVSFRTRPGQLVAVLGPNGAGKSTLFRCILGFLPRYRGEIALCGHDLRSLDRRSLARLAAYIPQSSAPVYNYTVRDTVLMGADPFHGPGPSQQETADRVLETLGIRDLAARGINEISGGERQLALIARAMAQQAKILLMDEPTASLDYGNQFRLLRQVRQLADSGYTVLLSTHNPEHAFRFATDVLVLREGGVRVFGPAAETLTEELLREIYRIPLTVADIPVPGGSVKGCVYDACPGGGFWADRVVRPYGLCTDRTACRGRVLPGPRYGHSGRGRAHAPTECIPAEYPVGQGPRALPHIPSHPMAGLCPAFAGMRYPQLRCTKDVNPGLSTHKIRMKVFINYKKRSNSPSAFRRPCWRF